MRTALCNWTKRSREGLSHTGSPQLPRVHAVIRLDLQGASSADILRNLNITAPTLASIRRSELYKERMEHLQGEIDARVTDRVATDPVEHLLRLNAKRAMEVSIGLLDSTDERIQQTTAFDILDRAGYTKKLRAEVSVPHTTVISDEAVKLLGETLRECGLRASNQS